jgi:hypothetical protein
MNVCFPNLALSRILRDEALRETANSGILAWEVRGTFRRLWRLAVVVACAMPLIASAQTLSVNNDVQTFPTLTNTAVTVSGKAELRITGTGDPIAGCTVNLTSPDAWFFMTNIVPSTVASTFLSRVRVDGAAAVVDSNVRVVQHGQGAVVIPHSASFAPLTVYEGKSFSGVAKALKSYTAYGPAELGTLNDRISSFKLKRGYTATIAQHAGANGISRNYVAADGDLEVGVLPGDLNDSVSFVRVFPWRWVSKKGSCDVDPVALKANWNYNWSISSNSTRDREYVAIKQQRWWPSLDQDWRARGINHLLGFNEPNNPVEDAYTSLDNGSTTTAVAAWPDLLSTGLRVGAPAVTDGGYNWLVDFMNKAEAAGMRVDYVPVHYYRSYWNKSDPAGAANQLYSFLKSIYDATQRPIWLTEFNNGANWTDNAHDPDTTQNRNAIEAMINMMDSTPWIERYSIYSRVEWFRQTHYDDGSITPMGQMYRDHVAPIGYVQEVPGSGISAAAHYTFDGELRDGLANGNDGMAVGAPVFSAGKYGQAISLDGATDYVQLPAQLGDSTDFTFVGWVNWSGGGNWQRIFDFGAGGTDNYMVLTPKSGSNTLRFIIRKDGVEQSLETSVLPVGAWTHVAVTLTGSTAKIFVNGALRATNTSFTFNPVDLNTKYNYLGKSQWPDPLFNGKLDDVRFLTTALSDAQIAAIAGSTTTPQFSSDVLVRSGGVKLQPFTGSITADASGGSGVRSFVKLGGPAWLAVAANGALTGVPIESDGGTNEFVVRVMDSNGAIDTAVLRVTVADTTSVVARYPFDGNTNAAAGFLPGTATGTPAYATGRFGSAIDLDGTDDFITLPQNVANHEALTLAMWVYWDGGNNWQRVFDFGNGTGEYLMLTPKSGGGLTRFEIVHNGVSQILETAALGTGQWLHIAVTLGAGTGRLYVNGTLADSEPITIRATDFAPAINYLGKSQWPDPLFNGRIDEFLIFNQVLAPAQIAALASAANRAPVFSVDPISKPSGSVGEIYEQTIAGTAIDPNADSTLAFSKVSGPAWLTVSPNGRISGVPPAGETGNNRFVVRVMDETLFADDAVLNVAVSGSLGLLAHHQFDGSTADNVGGPAGTTTGSPAYTTGVYDRAILFDGVNDVVQLRPSLLNGVADVTVAARVRWIGGEDWQRIFDFGNNTNQFLFLTPKTGSVSRFQIRNGATVENLDGPVFPIGEWTHVAVTLIGNTGTLYFNGSAVALGSVTIDPAAFSPTINYLGESQFAADPLFNGVIDDLRIYNRGLSSAEITALAVPPAAVDVPDSSYAGWAAGVAFPAGEAGAMSDPDVDGLTNAWEYVFGSNPLFVTSGAGPQQQVMTAAQLGLPGNKTYLTLKARVRKQRFGTALVPEAASSVQGLTSVDASVHALQAGTPVSDGAFEIITYYYVVPIEDSATGVGAMRLRVVLQ